MIRSILREVYDLPGWHTNRKIVVIESDDWGAIRIPSKKTLQEVSEKYPKNYNDAYSQFDTLASKNDLEGLFNTLIKFKDINGNHPIITANTVVTNPKFNDIKNSGFNDYSFEYFTKTLDDKYGDSVFKTWKRAINENLFKPQLHGRDHVDFTLWLELLKESNPILIHAFDNNIYSVNYNLNSKKKNLTAALSFRSKEEEKYKVESVSNGAKVFEDIFGYTSDTFIAPSYTWSNKIEKQLYIEGVKTFQGIRNQKEIVLGSDYKFTKHYIGQESHSKIKYLVRNVFFEPSLLKNFDVINDSLKRIYWSFKFHRPVIISMHRLNFIGELNQSNRSKNLILFETFLKELLIRWPDVEFMSSADLSRLINEK